MTSDPQADGIGHLIPALAEDIQRQQQAWQQAPGLDDSSGFHPTAKLRTGGLRFNPGFWRIHGYLGLFAIVQEDVQILHGNHL